MSNLDLTPYKSQKIGNTTFFITLHDEPFQTVENTTKEYVDKFVNLLNGAFREGVIYGSLNKIELS